MIIGYRPYLDCVCDLTEGKEVIASGMRQEAERCRLALERAVDGAAVSLLSSGDAGVYGMAGLVIEIAAKENLHAHSIARARLPLDMQRRLFLCVTSNPQNL